MSNNLIKFKQDLRAFAKKCKNVHYSDGLLITFLITGMVFISNNLFSDSINSSIDNQKQAISTSIKDMRQTLSKTRNENNKLLKNTNLELTQLIEQGDHVTKSPWSSWQFGINYFYNDWNASFKGRGDKVEDQIFTRDKSLNRYKQGSMTQSYGGTTQLGNVIEPNAAIPVSASLTPLVPQTKTANLALNVNLSGLPAFEPTTVMPPVTPIVEGPNPKINVNLNITSKSRGSGESRKAFATSGEAVFESVAITKGQFDVTTDGLEQYDRTSTYTASNVDVVQIYSNNSLTNALSGYGYGTGQNVSIPTSSTGNNAFFQVNGGSFGITLNAANINYTATNNVGHNVNRLAELVHQDVHGGSTSSTVNTALTTAGIAGLDSTTFAEIYKINAAESNVNKVDNYNVFANAGTINISGEKSLFTHSYNHSGNHGIVMNAGNVTLNKMTSGTETQHAVFLVSNDANNSNVDNMQQHFYNTGTVTANTDNTAMFLFVPAKKRVISVTNKGNLILNGNSSAGIFPNDTNSTAGVTLNLNFSTATSAGTQTQITDHNDSTGNSKYVNTLTGGITGKGDARTNSKVITINGKSSAGLYAPKDNSFINGQFATDVQTNATNNTEGSAGIFSKSDIDLQAHYIKVGGKYNVGVYPTDSSTDIYLGAGSIELNGGSNNTGIVVKDGKGRVRSNSEMLLVGGNNNTAIYASGHTGNGNTVEVKSIETDGTSQEDSVLIFADNGAKIKTADGSVATGSSLAGNGGLKVKVVTSSGTPTTFDSGTGKLNKNVGAVYATGSSSVDISQTGLNFGNTGSDYNVDITGARAVDSVTGANTNVYAGFGLFADNSTIKADYNKIKATDTGVGVASTNSGSIVLDNGEVNYSGSGYALYSDGLGTISLQNGTLALGGKATGYMVNATGSNPINLNGTTIDVQSDDVILMDLRNVASLNTSGIASPTGLGAYMAGTSFSGTSNGYKFKWAVVDGTTLNVDSNINKVDTTTTSDDYVFTRRLLLQNSIINVNAGNTVTANLNTADLTGIDANLTVPVGLAVAASSKSTGNTTTGINNNGTVTVNRTDSGNGGVGLYVNYGHINNNASGVVDVETTGNNPNAVGIYGTSTPIVNNGTVTVGGNNSFGILGLSYRLNNSGVMVDPSTEAYYNNTGVAGTLGHVDILNNGTITMNNDSAIGIYAHNNSLSAVNGSDQRAATDIEAINHGTITMNGGNNAIGMGTNRGTLTNVGTINVNGTVSAGMYGTNSSTLTNAGTINVAATAPGTESIGIYTDDINTPITTSGTINVGNSSYGIFGKTVNMTGGAINVGDNGVGIYSTGPTVNVNGTVTVGNNNAVGVYVEDETTPAATTITGNANMTVGDTNSFGYLITSKGAPVTLTTAPGTTAKVGEKSVYIYSAQPYNLGGTITNNTAITTTKNNGYGIYSSQNADNYGSMNLTSGVGNIGIYTINGATGINHAGVTIDVGPTNLTSEEYGIGMATGYFDKATGNISNQGTIENHGTINVTKDNSIGMYAVGSGSTAINQATGVINLDGNNTTGMYIDRNATGINYGTIQTVPNATGTGIKGVVAVNGGIIKNYGTIKIVGSDNMGVYRDGKSTYNEQATNSSTVPQYVGTATDEKTTGSVTIQVPPKSVVPTVTLNGVPIPITQVDTDSPTPTPTDVYITDSTGTTTLNLALAGLQNAPNTAEASSIGMYVDTSGVNYTNPIQGLQYLTGLKEINLIMGTEAAKYTGAKAIKIGDNILNPYNTALTSVVTTGGKINVNSGSLTWMAQPVQGTGGTKILDSVYLVKVPYTDFASDKDPDTYNFLDGLEQRYGVEGVDSREKLLFNKLNDLGKGEGHIFAQAVNEMKGYQYSNTQQRINETGEVLDKEFDYLQDQWRNPSKQNNKIKVFGMRNEYNTDTAGVIDNTSNAYGVAYVHENETIKLGNKSGWYAGVVNNYYKFKDLGGSRENQTMVKAGLFKTMSPATDHNGSLQWTIAGDVFAGRNEMKRKFWIVDDTFEAKSNYNSYGIGLKTDIGYDFRTSERTHIRPYGALKMEYGRFSDIKEDNGEMRLEVEGNDYFSVKPEVGVEFKYVQPLAVRTQLSVGLTAAYENELGKIHDLNKARVRYTTADWYNLRNEKEDRKGNGKFDLNIGIDNTRFGVTVNAGYDTKGENVRGGIGFRAIY